MSIIEEKDYNERLIEKFKSDYLPQKFYYRHSDIDIFVNITLTQLLNYNLLPSEKIKNFLQKNTINNYKYYSEISAQQKKVLKSFKNENNQEINNSIISFELPEFEIFFVAKLFIDGIERKPECQTKLLFNSKNINQYISMRFKYKDLTTDSYIDLELYSMQIKGNNLLGKTRIYLFDDKMNLNQGRHIFKLIKIQQDKNSKADLGNNTNEINEDFLELNEIEKEIDLLINNYYTAEEKLNINNINDSKNVKSNNPRDNNLNNYYYNPSKKKLDIKPDSMKYFENTLNELLSQTNNSFIVVKFPSFSNIVIYEEDVSEDYQPVFNSENSLDDNKEWIFDPYINIGRHDFNNKDNPISEKFSNLMRENDNDDDLYARDIRLNPVAMHRINILLNTPDFIKLDNNDITLFWNYRYELLKNNTPLALTKIMNSVKWGNLKSENEFIKNILKYWKTIELSDILFMLSRKFSVNNIYPNSDTILNNLDGMKELRKFAVKKLGEHSNEELNFILLQLVQAIRYEDISSKKNRISFSLLFI